MASNRTAGRPTKTKATLSKGVILATALPLVQKDGTDNLSFRQLSDILNVTPMAIKYHVGTKQQLLAGLVELAFRDTLIRVAGDAPSDRIRYILTRYCRRACQHANLLRCILADPTLMSDEIHRITAAIRSNTQMLNDGDPEDVMLNLLVDYTHGFVFSVAAAPAGHGPTERIFLRSLDWILSRTGTTSAKRR